jgi:AcrR family transcriptional regulator
MVAVSVSEPEIKAVTEKARPLRADAQRNRDKLLAAATAAFAEEGEDVALETVAARAGVGIGTLYRHFPSRDALVVAAYRHEVDALCAAAAGLLAARPADAALRAWTERFADYVATKRAMGNALRSAAASDSPLFAETRALILGTLRLLLDAGAAAGTLRADVDPKDVMRVMNGIWYLPAGPEWREDVGRMLDLLIDGLRYGAPAAAQQE